ncbi:MAG: 3-hydroxyacyl-CoA dehydrogenase family protein [Eggerthellaceae bacterium]|nr:3-hydroxyacyl-CoA dehydrogenase family protein [Eggerthellaceae bacterium]
MAGKPKILVVGAGTMGNSIAHVFAAHGYVTYMSSRHQESLDKAQECIADAVALLKNEGIADDAYEETLQKNLHPVRADRIPDIAQEVDVVFETIVEDPQAKREIYGMLSENCRADCILASNTSGMDVFTLCEGTVENMERLIIAHWFNPPHLMKLVEVVKGPKTSDATVARMRKLLESVGRKPTVLNTFVPGFIVNRMATVINRELYYMIDQGWVTAQDAEDAIKYTHGLRFGFEGPLALWDFVGLKTTMAVAHEGVLETLCNDTDTLPLGEKLVAEGKTGVKAGEGALKYGDIEEYAEKRSHRVVQMTKVIEAWDREDVCDEPACHDQIGTPMQKTIVADGIISQFEMSEEDLGDFSVSDVACISCRPLCTNKVMRRYHGGPLFMCTRKEATKQILEREYARMHPGE